MVLVLDGNDEIDITTAEQRELAAAEDQERPPGTGHVHGPVLEMAERSGLASTADPG